MFWRLVFRLLRGSRGRFALAIFAIVSGATVISALLNLDLGVQNKLTQEFRTLGANIVISPAGGAPAQLGAAEAPSLMPEKDVLEALQRLPSAQVAGAAPYLYVVARAENNPVVVAGTWLDQAQKLDPTWKLEGNWVASRSDDSHCLVGRNVARRLHLAPGAPLELHYMNRTAQCAVAGIVDAGGTEDNQVFASLSSVQSLANLPGQIGLAQLSVAGTAQVVAALLLTIGQRAAAISSATHPPGGRSGRRAARPHPPARRFHGAADSDPHGAVRARHHGRAGDGKA